jgi:hypothetical protein
MAELILQKTANCAQTVSTTVNTTEPTRFTLLANGSGIVANILLNGAIVATLTDDDSMFIATIDGEYTVRISGVCKVASVYTEAIEAQRS